MPIDNQIKIFVLLFVQLVSCDFRVKFYSHVFTVGDMIDHIFWNRVPVATTQIYTYVFFSRIDPDVSVSYMVSEDHGATYHEKWRKTGIDIPRVVTNDEYLYKVKIMGSGTIAFTEGEGLTEFCNGKIYPFNNPRADIEMTDTYTIPPSFPKLKKDKEFCVLYANADETVDVFKLQMGPNDVSLYTYGNNFGTITQGLHLDGIVDTTNGYQASCFYFKLEDDYAPGRKFMINVTSHLQIDDDAIYPPLYIPTSEIPTSYIKTPTQSRKVHILTDNPNATEEITKTENMKWRAIVKSPLTHQEIATVATTATVSVGMIVSAIVLFILYVHSKARKLKELTDFDFDGSDSHSLETSEYSFSYYTYSESYYTYSGSMYSYSVSNSVQ